MKILKFYLQNIKNHLFKKQIILLLMSENIPLLDTKLHTITMQQNYADQVRHKKFRTLKGKQTIR